MQKIAHLLLSAFLAILLSHSTAFSAPTEVSCKALASRKYEVYAPLDFEGKNRIPMYQVEPLVDIGTKVGENARLVSYRIPKELLLLSMEDINVKLQEIIKYYKSLNLLVQESILSRNDFVMLSQPDAGMVTASNASKDISLTKEINDQKVEQLTSEIKSLYSDLNVLDSSIREYYRLLKLDYGHLPEFGYLTAQYESYVLYINPLMQKGANILTNDPLMILGSLDPIRIVAFSDQSQLSHFAIGKSYQITFDSLPGKTFTAKVVSLQAHDYGNNFQLPSTFEVYLELPNPDFAIKDGMRGHVQVD